MRLPFTALGLMSMSLPFIVFLSLCNARPQSVNYRHAVLHRAKGHHADDLKNSSLLATSSGFRSSSTATLNALASDVSADTRLELRDTGNEGYIEKRQGRNRESAVTQVVTALTTQTVIVTATPSTPSSSGTAYSLTSTAASSTIYLSGTESASDTVSSAGGTSITATGNLFDGSYGSFLLGPVPAPAQSNQSSTSTAASSHSATANSPFEGSYQSFLIGNPPVSVSSPSRSATASTSATPSSKASSSPLCPGGNGTTYNSIGGRYEILCGVDYPGQDIMPFLLVTSYDVCIRQCDVYNSQHSTGTKCLGAVFAPDRITYGDDCYLKSSLNDPTAAASLLIGATLMSTSTAAISQTSAGIASSTGSATQSQTSGASVSSAVSGTGSAMQTSSTSSGSSNLAASSKAANGSTLTVSSTGTVTVSQVPVPSATYGFGSSVIVPKVTGSILNGPATNKPTTQYVNYKFPVPITLDSSLLVSGINLDLTKNYPIAGDTGTIDLSYSTYANLLAPLNDIPHMSRDGRKGGYLNGHHLFIFCDTSYFGTTTATAEGTWLGFISSSVATDTGMNGLTGKALTLEDGIGGWGDNVGRLRGFAPQTTGEEAYNLVMSGGGNRIAIWPEASIIPLDATHAALYAALVFDKVDMATQAANFTDIGNTLLTVTAGGPGGPIAERTVSLMFNQDEVQWGSAGGIRSWGVSGVGGSDGRVYLFGQVSNGMLVARTTPSGVADRSTFEYWDGSSWSTTIQTPSSTAYFVEVPFMDFDMFYSPRHLTFIMVYLTSYADSTFYYRYLLAGQAILPPYNGGDPSVDFVGNIVKYKWSDEQVLYKAAKPPSGNYIYAGGVHAGYFGTDDITNGGSKLLISWTANTGEDAGSVNSGYFCITAEVDFA